MADTQVLNSEPRYHVDEFVNEILGRRKMILHEVREELAKMVAGLADQLWLRHMAGDLDLRTVKLQPRWLTDGRLIVDLTYKDSYGVTQTLAPKDIRPW